MREVVNDRFDHLDHSAVRGPSLLVEGGDVKTYFGFGFKPPVIVEEVDVRRLARVVCRQCNFATLEAVVLNGVIRAVEHKVPFKEIFFIW